MATRSNDTRWALVVMGRVGRVRGVVEELRGKGGDGRGGVRGRRGIGVMVHRSITNLAPSTTLYIPRINAYARAKRCFPLSPLPCPLPPPFSGVPCGVGEYAKG